MKIFTRTISALILMLLCGVNYASAADIDLSSYKLVKSVTWGGDVDITRDVDNKLAIKAFETGNGRLQELYDVATPAECSGWIGVQLTNSQDGKGWWNRPGSGLWSYNATRSAAVYGDDLVAGSVVVFTCSQDASSVITLTNANDNNKPDGPFTIQQSEDKLSYYCTIVAETGGYVGFCGQKSKGYITKIEVYQPNTEPYTVYKTITFGGTEDILRDTNVENKMSIRAYETGNGRMQDLYPVTSPAEAVGSLAVQLTNSQDGKGWWNRPDNGLWSYNATRSAAVYGDELTTGVEVIFTCTQNASKVMTLTNGDNKPDGPFTYKLSDDGLSYICTITAETGGYVGFCGNKSSGYIKEITIRKPNKATVLADYTVKYQDTEGNELKEATTGTGIAGNNVSLTDADKANITLDGITYVYESDNTDSAPIAEDGSSVYTIVFHAAKTFSYVVNEVANGTVVRSTEGSSYETANISVPFRKYNALDGVLYHKDNIGKEYNYKFTLTEDKQKVDLAYTATDVTDVVFLSEGEDIEGMTPCNSANTGIRSSNSASGYPKDGDVAIATLSAGTYKLTAFIYDASKSPDSHWIFKAGEEQIADLNCTTVNIQELKSEEFTLTAPTTIYIAQGGSNTMGLDLIYITGNGQVVEATETVDFEIVDEGGFATYFNSQKAFVMPEGVEGGIVANIADNKSEVVYLYKGGDVVPAGTPLILSGAVKAYQAEVTTTDAQAPTGNLLKGYDSFTAKEDANANYYFYKLSRSTAYGEKRLGFFWFSEDGHTNDCKPNKAYLQLSASQAAGFFILIDEGATAIKGISTGEDSQTVYTLSGIRIDSAKATKGIYIVNGKKIVK